MFSEVCGEVVEGYGVGVGLVVEVLCGVGFGEMDGGVGWVGGRGYRG